MRPQDDGDHERGRIEGPHLSYEYPSDEMVYSRAYSNTKNSVLEVKHYCTERLRLRSLFVCQTLFE